MFLTRAEQKWYCKSYGFVPVNMTLLMYFWNLRIILKYISFFLGGVKPPAEFHIIVAERAVVTEQLWPADVYW